VYWYGFVITASPAGLVAAVLAALVQTGSWWVYPAELQAKLDAARMRLHEIVVHQMKSWLPSETLKRPRDAEQWRRREVRLHFGMLKRFREEQRGRQARHARI
jgi:hypothetical protein